MTNSSDEQAVRRTASREAACQLTVTLAALLVAGACLATSATRVSADPLKCTDKDLKNAQHTISIQREAGKPISGKPEYELPGIDICQIERTEGPTAESWQTGKEIGYTVDEVLPESLKKDPNIRGVPRAAHRIYLRASDKGKDIYVKRGIAITGRPEDGNILDEKVLAVINTQKDLITLLPNPSYDLATLVKSYNSLILGPAR
jgi:hypothetical protein